MKTKHTPTSINLLYWLSNFSLVMLSIVFFVVIVISILVFTGTGNFDTGFSFSVPFPGKVDYISSGNLISNNQDIKVELVDASAKLKILNPTAIINKFAVFIMLGVLLFSGLLIVIFRKFIKNVKAGLVFTVENINLLKYLSYGLIVVWAFQSIFIPVFYLYISDKFKFEDTTFTIELFQYSSTLVIALVIWVLAHIFLKGVRLQQEKDLTI